MKNILFISAGSFAFGESVMALNFARSLPPSKYRPCFIASPLSSVLLDDYPELKTVKLIKNAQKINRLMVVDFLEHYPPDLIVLCDFLTFDFSQPEFGITLQMLRGYDKPIISLDSYEWESGDFTLDFFSGINKQLPRMLLQLDGALRPCPLNKPVPAGGRVASYSFLHQIQEWSNRDARQVREGLGISPDDFVIFSASAVWQSLRPKNKSGGLFGNIITELFSQYISKLDRPIHWIRVGPERQQDTTRKGLITEHNFSSLPESDFDRLLAASDLLMTSNVASTTLAKCIKNGKSALLLYSSIQANGPEDLSKYGDVRINDSTLRLIENAYPIQPFMMFPLGWYRFLKPVMSDNPYLDTFYKSEILDEERVMSILEELISKKRPELSGQREQYTSLLEGLRSPGECLEHFMGV